MSINEWGQLFVWGSNQFGQLGYNKGDDIQVSPKIVKELASKHIVQIASGDYHCLALTNSKQFYFYFL